MASARLQRWGLLLGAYKYRVEYRRGGDHANANALSRLPLSEQPKAIPLPGDTILLLDHQNTTPVTADRIKVWTAKDRVLSQVRYYTIHGWPISLLSNEELLPFT